MQNRTGAPFGGRVHFLLDELTGEFLKQYDVEYNYNFKNYLFYRRTGYLDRTLIDLFIVVRTSKKNYRVNYCNVKHLYFCTFCGDFRDVAQKMKNIYKTFKRL